MTWFVEDIEDEKVRENFKTLRDLYEKDQLWVREFVPVEVNVDGATSEGRIAHTFGAIPTDLIQTWKEGTGSITWEYGQFTDKVLVYTTTGACKVRALIGRASGRKL